LNRHRYALAELVYRRGRSIATATSIALAVAAGVLLTALATSYAGAVQAPMKSVGADVVGQLSGDIPPKLEGLVFPHPNALLTGATVASIRGLPGVLSVTRAVYLWELAPDHYQSVLGVDDGETGLGALNGRLTEGRPLGAADRAVLADSDFAARNGVRPGATLTVGGEPFTVAGIVDAASGGKVVRADVYLPLALAQSLAAAAPQVQALYPFGPDDANLLLVKVERRRLEAVVAQVQALLGKKGIVSSELSFRETLENVLFLSERMGLILALVIGIFAAAFVLRATASAVNERQRELAILRAVGWPWRQVRRQVVLENGLLTLAGAAAGLVLALVIARSVGGIEVTIEFPWDLSSTPHFLPEATLERRQTVIAPLALHWQVMLAGGLGGVLVGLLAALAALTIRRPQPWSLLRSE
jgi:putative ABC transport system permease protein